MIPSAIGPQIIQYTGSLKRLTSCLNNVQRIKITDSKTKLILFNSGVKLHDKILDWCPNECRFHFKKIRNTVENSSDILFITDMKTNRIKSMSLENTYNFPWYLLIEYKTDETIKSNDLYELEFIYKNTKKE